MKLPIHVFAISFLLTGCVTMTDLDSSQSKLSENAKTRKVYADSKSAGKSTAAKCLKSSEDGNWEIEISHEDEIVKQGDQVVGYFKTLCLKKSAEHKKLEITGVHAGGGMGKAFFLLPRVSVFDEKWNLVAQNLTHIKQNAFSGNLDAEMDISKIPPGKYFVILEADNRSGKRNIGEYTQSTYAVVPIITSVSMYSLPTGKARVSVK